MILRLLAMSLSLAFVLQGPQARAGETELNDVGTEAEELSADSEAAIAQAKEAKIRIAKEQAENDRQLKAATKARDLAKVKRLEARKQLKHDQAVIDALLIAQGKLKKELQKSEQDIASSEKAMQDSVARTEKKNQETAALQTLKAEKIAKFKEVSDKRDEAIKAGKAADQVRDQAAQEFHQASDEEKLAVKNFEKTRIDEIKHKVQLEAQIAEFKARYKQSHEHVAKLDKELARLRQNNVKLEEQAKVGEGEVQKTEAHEAELKAQIPAPVEKTPLAKTDTPPAPGPASAPAEKREVNSVATSEAMTLKRDCKIHDGPSRTAKVVGVKLGGQSVSDGQDSKGWIEFPLEDGQKGFVATSCF